MLSPIKFLLGSVCFEIIGGNAEKFLTDCSLKGYPIQKVRPTDFGFTAQIPLRYYLKLHKLCVRRRCRLKVYKKQGAFFLVWPLRHRWGILAGFCAMLIALLSFPRTVWTVQFHNFTKTEENLLRQQLYSFNISEGSMPTTEDLIDIQQRLFVSNEQYGWIKLNFVDGKLIVEKISAVPAPEMEQTQPAAIVALCDGVIDRIEVEGGFIQKVSGQKVSEGEVIISALRVGRRDKLHTDRAIGSVYAFVNPIYEITIPLVYETHVPSMQTKNHYGIFMFGHTFNMPFFSKPDDSAQIDTIYTPLTFLGMPLPATVIKTQYRNTETITVNLSQQQATDIARSRIYSTIASDLPECKVLSFTQSVSANQTQVTLKIAFNANANIAKVVEGWNA